MSKDFGPNKLNSQEILCAELTWGGVPVDIEWVRESKLFRDKFLELFGTPYEPPPLRDKLSRS